MKVGIAALGMIDYDRALDIQEKLVQLRQNNEIDDVLLLLEHPPVITVGRRGSADNIRLSQDQMASEGVRVFNVSRGGDVTYHGPGQLVGYPVVNLNGYGRDIRQFVWKLEEVFIRMLKESFDIEAARDEGKYTGVWIGDRKITAIGIAVKHRVTMHGFAFNINTDLEHFKWIVPCGLSDRGVTSLETQLGCRQDMAYMTDLTAGYFCSVFGLEPYPVNLDELI